MRQQSLVNQMVVTNNYDTYAPGTEGSFIQFVVPEDWDTDVYYVCQNHVGMGNSATAPDEGEDADVALNVMNVVFDPDEGTLTFTGDVAFSGTPYYEWQNVTLSLSDDLDLSIAIPEGGSAGNYSPASRY